MRVVPLAFDSMGVRSMATLVETADLSLVIDPSAALGPLRFGLPPHPLEWERLRVLGSAVEEAAARADVLVVTHYHYDHHDLGTLVSLEVYRGKRVFVKHPTEKINRSQREVRAPRFLKAIEGLPSSLEYAEGSTLRVGGTEVEFSEAVPHGVSDRLGYVVEVSVREGEECLVFTSDVEGPALREQVEFILNSDPTILIVDGPPTYLAGYKYPRGALLTSQENLIRVMEETRVRRIVIDHHSARDLKWRSALSRLVEGGRERGVEVVLAAEAAGVPVDMLEARRRDLYRQFR
ncbi:MAG: hypothetical protein DRO06_02795 [Thermoproteota archaeon]|nr:MAG: hypothetical protein DRO06_02795 [Candidatus Korarchaeota archaeon]